METISTCFSCEMSLPPEAKFCLECGTKVRCSSCATALVKGSKFCFNCGDAVANESKSASAMNSIEFNETENGRNFKAAFTDSVGKSISESFGQFMANRLNQTKALNAAVSKEEKEDAIELKAELINQGPSVSERDERTKQLNVTRLFRDKDDKVILIEPRLKATGKLDYAKRLTYLFLFYSKEKGQDSVTRSSITNIIESVGLYDGNFKAWISSAPDLLNEKDGVSLRIPGEEVAKKCLSDVYDQAVEDKWTLDQLSGRSAGTKSKVKPGIKGDQITTEKVVSKGSKGKTESYQFVDLGLSESEREDLRSFFGSKEPKSQNDVVLVLAYWLKVKGKKASFNENIIYSAIQIVEAETPRVLSQVLRNIKNDSKILKSSDGYKLNHVGEDYVKIKLKPKKQ